MYLSEILAYKKIEVKRAILEKPLSALLKEIEYAPSPRSFLSALRKPKRSIGLIAEVKKASPSAGVIRENFDFVEIANLYASCGADCLSVLTDEKFFQGHLSYLTEIKKSVTIPLLRKDFIVDAYQIYEARAAGADAILLIVAALDKSALKYFYQLAKELGLDVLVETHSVDEMQIAAEIGVELIGVNSRNLKTFVTDLGIVEAVAAFAPKGALLVAESAIKTSDDVRRVVNAGATSILVGETLMRSSNIAESIDRLIGRVDVI